MKTIEKKGKFLAIMLMLLMATGAMGQWTNFDTIPGHYDKYYYGPNGWYDKCEWFQKDGYVNDCWRTRLYLSPSWSAYAQWYYTDQPIRVKGLVALVDIYCNHESFRNPYRLPEYMYLYQFDTSDFMIMPPDERPLIKLDSVRWDTVKPHIMELTEGVSNPSAQYCYAFECYFDQPVMVDSSFYIYGTHNSNAVDTHTLENIYMPTFYLHIRNWDVQIVPNCAHSGPWNPECFPEGRWHQLSYVYNPMKDRWGFINSCWPEDQWGLFLPIVDQWQLNGLPSNPADGTVTGGGLYPDGTCHELYAEPRPGRVFMHWEDGDTANPKMVCLSSDTTLTAYFGWRGQYLVETAVNVLYWGTVEGAGLYNANTEVELRAIPANGFIFEQWNDGDTTNPRTFTLTQDTLFTAVFALDTTHEGISEADGLAFAVTPNPTGGELTVSTGMDTPSQAEVFDAAGRCVLRCTLQGPKDVLDVRQLPAGRYLLCLSNGNRSGSRAFVKK